MCICPVWVDYAINGRRIRKSLDTTSLQDAQAHFDLLPPGRSVEPIDEVMVAKAILAIDSFRTSAGPDLVYFIGNSRAIKIGVSRDVYNRLMDLQSASSTEIRIRRVFAGGYPLEKELHAICSSFSTRGEWFRLSPTLVAIIKRAKELVWYGNSLQGAE